MAHRYEPREPWRWEEEREREDRRLELEGRFARHAGDARWGTGGMRQERPRAFPERPPGPAGPYAGRGPRGYRRSDDRIYRDVCQGLADSGDLDASEVEVTVASGEVTLHGLVATRVEKRLAEDISEGVSGVVDVHNRLRLRQVTDPVSPVRGSRSAPVPSR